MLLNKHVDLLIFTENSPGHFTWTKAKTLTVSIIESKKTNLFSKVGIGVKNVVFTLRKTAGISLANATRYGETFCFLTDIQEKDKLFLLLSAAKVNIENWVATRNVTQKNEMKQPIADSIKQIANFPAPLTEKYVRYAQGDPLAQIEQLMVIVTPKVIKLRAGDRLERTDKKGDDGKSEIYAVQTCHTLDEYKNEYEIYKCEDT